MTKPMLVFRQLTEEDVKSFREIRLEALQKHPENFTSCYRQEGELSLQYFSNMLQNHKYIACFKEGVMVGVCGIMPAHESLKKSHTARITGFYVRPEYRGRGFAKKLFEKTMEDIEERYEKVLLNVNTKNPRAHSLYKAIGFKDFGIDKRAFILRDGTYVHEFLMVKFLGY